MSDRKKLGCGCEVETYRDFLGRVVGKIVAHENGQWVVQSGNDGHAVRTRPRSLAGAIAFRHAYAAF